MEQPFDLLAPRRSVVGISAVLLPCDEAGAPDWAGFEAHVDRTGAAGLRPALNMDTGHVLLADPPTRRAVLDHAVCALPPGSRWYAGAVVDDEPGDPWALDRHRDAIGDITGRGGIPVVFPSYGLAGLTDPERVDAYAELGRHCGQFVAFELAPVFAPQGFVVSLDAFRKLLEVPQCVGVKHSSLRRAPEWERLRLRDAHRPDFHVFTGNDLAIDMVMYGSDYLLGLSTFAPHHFALRDALWAAGDPGFHDLNDALQALGAFAFRAPVPAYKHDAAMTLAARGWIASDAVPPGAARRPGADREVLAVLLERLDAVAETAGRTA